MIVNQYKKLIIPVLLTSDPLSVSAYAQLVILYFLGIPEITLIQHNKLSGFLFFII